ncbi:MAG: Y-family DNA polymerase [Bacteriovoracaceae bacterium]|nr:Y-family DNA polymerase [Bacteriovoracaceae bacterium]
MGQVFALVDCNSFFCSCERLYRPDLHKRPIIVLSNNDGCAISLTKEAKALGLKMGAPYFRMKQLCEQHQVAVFSSNFSLYTDLSRRVMETIYELTPEIEIYSVDEAWSNLTGIASVDKHGRMLKETIELNTGIPVSVGIAPTKTLAKIANHIAKKSDRAGGVVSLMEKKYQDIALERVPVGNIWGIGRRNSLKLRLIGIKTAKDLRDYPNEKEIQKKFTKVGIMIKHELQGICCFPFNDKEAKKKKEILSSRTFGTPVYRKKDLQESVANYVSYASEKLRKQQSLCSIVEVFARTNPHKEEVQQYYAFNYHKALTATSDTRKLIKSAFCALEKLFKSGIEYKKAGVRLSNLTDREEVQLNIFEQMDSTKDDALMTVIDKINTIEGSRLIKSAACGVNNEAWAMLRSFKSPRYTTSWLELPTVK